MSKHGKANLQREQDQQGIFREERKGEEQLTLHSLQLSAILHNEEVSRHHEELQEWQYGPVALPLPPLCSSFALSIGSIASLACWVGQLLPLSLALLVSGASCPFRRFPLC